MTVLAFDPQRRTNAQLIGDLRTLGYIGDDDDVLDPTYGVGRWWNDWRPESLIATDLDPMKSPDTFPHGVDFTAMPWDSATFDVVAFDPPYKLNGTSGGGGPATSDVDYGVGGPAVRWQDRHTLIFAGIKESTRVLRPGGYLIVKCADQVCSGKVRRQTVEFAQAAINAGCSYVDELHVYGSRKQPNGRSQVHARRNYSTALVMRKAGR